MTKHTSGKNCKKERQTEIKKVKNFDNGLIKFQFYGVKIGIRAGRKTHLEKTLERLERIFPNGLQPISEMEIEYLFRIKTRRGGKFDLYRNEEKLIENSVEEFFYDFLESRIRVTIGEFAVGRVFLHAGVIGWQGKAIIIPGRSFAGKTTLVAALLKKGAQYYSDEYAVLDADGCVEPFPKWLSMRGIIDDYTQLDCPVESLGGIVGTKAIPVGLVVLAEYQKKKKMPKKWQPKRMSRGQGIMEIIPHTMPITNKPKETLNVLNNLASRAIIVKTVRGEADEFAEILLNYFESVAD